MPELSDSEQRAMEHEELVQAQEDYDRAVSEAMSDQEDWSWANHPVLGDFL
jgi:hypothetical protein